MKYITEPVAQNLLQDIVSIPSFVNKQNPDAEKNVEVFLIDWFKTNLPHYKYKKLQFAKNRNNLIFYTETKNDWMFACHMDTVPPFSSNDLKLKKEGDKIFGLGTKDMKGGIISTLLALKEAHALGIKPNSSVLFYGDEEYTQEGIRVLAEKHADQLPIPKLMISPESRFALGIGARGMCVVNFTVIGKRAHSSRPFQGIDAVKTFYKTALELEKEVGKKTKLGRTSVTITQLEGGLLVDGKISTHNGTVPDICKGTFSLRVADTNLNAEKISQKIIALVEKYGAKVENLSIIADYPARICDKKDIKQLIKAVQKVAKKAEFNDPGTTGYNDAAILSKAMGVPLVNFGPYGENNHNPNEWVSLQSIISTAKVYLELITENS